MVVVINCKVSVSTKKFHPKDIKKALRSHALHTRSDFLNEYKSGTKTGRLYGKHRASAPNETPAKKTGNLGRAFIFNSSSTSSIFGTNAKYGEFLEFGTKKIKPRNGVIQAITKNMKKLEEDLMDLYRK